MLSDSCSITNGDEGERVGSRFVNAEGTRHGNWVQYSQSAYLSFIHRILLFDPKRRYFQVCDLNPSSFQAGNKALLLKSKLEAKNEGGEKDDAKGAMMRAQEIAAERARVIAAYRMLKKSRRN
ncbi:hypothetical protein Tcan_00947, partial [Toxocara canis]